MAESGPGPIITVTNEGGRMLAYMNFIGRQVPETTGYPINADVVKKYFKVTDMPAEADFAIAFIESPGSGNGYSADDAKKGGNGYVPISLQYRDYTATRGRDTSIAGGDPLEGFTSVPHDMTCYTDSEGNTYDFGFGLNWNGVIQDERKAHYVQHAGN